MEYGQKSLKWTLTFCLLIIIVLFSFFIIKKPGITGFVTYKETITIKNWSFDNSNDYSYDGLLINLSDAEVKLIKSIIDYNWSVESIINISIISALEYEPGKKSHNRTSKVQVLDNDSADIKKDKEIFDITFNKEISNDDTISFYIMESDNINQSLNITIYLCDNGTFCNSSNYGLLSFNGSEGWYNITVGGLNSNKTIFNIDPTQNVKLDYIKAVHRDTTNYKGTNISYPKFASIETKEFNAAGLSTILDFYKNDLLNNQNITYHYSTDSGNSWNIISSNPNITTSNGKLRIRANLSGNGTETPILYDFAILYLTKVCNENWSVTYGDCLSNDKRVKYYIDKNECGTIKNLPIDNGTFETCDYDNNPPNVTNFLVNPRFGNIGILVNISLNISDENGTKSVIANIQKPDENNIKIITLSNEDKNFFSTVLNTANMSEGIYLIDISATDLNNNAIENDNIGLIALSSYARGVLINNSLMLKQNEKFLLDARQEANAILEIKAKSDISASISVAYYSKNFKNLSANLTEFGKYIDIEADNKTKQNLAYISIRVYYTDEEIINSSLDEQTLKINYFNETSNKWQILNSTVNDSGDYVEATIEHLSTFGIFGERKNIGQTSSSGSGTASEGGGTTTTVTNFEQTKASTEIKKEMPKKEVVLDEAKIETRKETKEECDYKISVSIPEPISFIEHTSSKGLINNNGNCEIESLNISTSPELSNIIKIENKTINNVKANESVEFLLVKKLVTSRAENSLIQGFIVKTSEKSIETYNGSITFDISAQNRSFKERVDIKVNVLKPVKPSLINLKMLISVVLLFSVISIFYIFYIKVKKKNQI